MVRRVRHPIGNIKILCAERGHHSPDGASVYVAQIQKLLAERMAAELSEFDPRPAQEIYAELCDQLKSCPHHAAWFELKVLENLEQPHLYDFVCELLRESGHEVLELDLDSPETQKHARVKEEVEKIMQKPWQALKSSQSLKLKRFSASRATQKLRSRIFEPLTAPL
jgi:hypothetical protein